MQPPLSLPLLNDGEDSKSGSSHALVSTCCTAGFAISALCILLVLSSPSQPSKDFLNKVDAASDLLAVPSTAPLFRITASTSFDAGVQHGKLARARIHGWFASAEMQSVFAFVAGDGKQAFRQLRTDNEKEFPEYADEIRGIALGAEVSVEQVWCANMLNELENLMDTMGEAPKHCSDIYAISSGGYANGFAHGHNDDWSDAVKPFWYILAVTYNTSSEQEKLGFEKCAGVAYPAALVGWAPTWNNHGIFATQNSLVPRQSRAGGLACAFVQRRAVCGARSLEEAVRGLAVKGWSDSASMNVVDVPGKRMANVELWEDLHSVAEVTEAMGNYSHFNEFKHLKAPNKKSIDDPRLFVHDPRQARVDSLPAPRSDTDIMARLSDSQVFRPTATITTVVLNGTTGSLKLWCGVPSLTNPPSYSWDLLKFF